LFLVALGVQRWLRIHTLLYYHKLPGKHGKLQVRLLHIAEREGSLLARLFPSMTPAPEMDLSSADGLKDPLERSLLSESDASPETEALAKEARKEIGAERKAQVRDEIERLKGEMKKLD
jgi:hypothetical protein